MKAQERRGEKLRDSITFDEIRRVQRKAMELLGKTESEGDYRGAIVAAGEVREYLVSVQTSLYDTRARAPALQAGSNPGLNCFVGVAYPERLPNPTS